MSRPILSLLFTLLTLLPLTHAVCPANPTIQPLTDGVPFQTYSTAGQLQYFSFNFTRLGLNTPLTIAITNYADDVPELYVHPTNKCPSRWEAGSIYRSGSSDNLIRILGSQITSSQYYITVFATHNSNYSIVAKYSGKTVLSDGLPQAARAAQYDTEYLVANLGQLTPGNSKIRFYLTPLRGNAVFYVSTTNTEPNQYSPNTTTRSSYNSLVGQNELIWDLNDRRYPQPVNGILYIGVYGISDCRFQFIVHQYSTNAILVPGQTQMSQLQRLQYHYYTTRIENLNCSLRVTITAFTGDPDIYTSAKFRRPSSIIGQWDHKSSNGGRADDSVVYTTTIPNHDYGIAVYGFTNATYSIVSTVDCAGDNSTDFIYLIDGQPQEGALAVNKSAWYRISMAEHSDLTLSITVNSGDPDIYVSTIAPPSYSRVNESDHSSFDWSSTSYGSDILVINHLSTENHDSPTYCPKDGQEFCEYYIQVFAWEGCSYTIVATTAKSITQLRNGIAVHEDLAAGAYEYFTIPVDLDGETLTVTITDLGRGDPDLFMNIAPPDVIIEPSMFPNMTNNPTWSSRRSGSESISIPATDPKYRSQARYLISVHAWTATSFSIVANFNRTARLNPGTPQGGSVTPAAWVYYDYIADDVDDEALSFMFTPINGYANMYISTAVYPQLSRGTFNYSRAYYQTPQRIDINHTTVRACHPENGNPCIYRIGIYGITSSQYTLTVVAGSNIRLTNGVAVSGELRDQKWAYYEIYVPNQGKPLDLSIVVTPYSGDPDLYLTNSTERPTTDRSSYRWFSTRFGGDTIDIENCKAGTYVLGILCLGNCSYTVTSLIQSDDPDPLSLTMLIAGQPQNGMLLKNHWRYYAYDHTPSANYTTEISYVVQAVYGDPDLYVTWDGRFPNRTSWNQRSMKAGSQTDIVKIDKPVGSLHKIGIFSFATTQYTITAQVLNIEIPVANRIVDNDPVQVNTTTQSWRYYQIDNLNGKSVNIKLTSFNSSDIPQMYMSTIYTFPNKTHKTWSGEPFPEKGKNVYGKTIDTTDDKFVRSGTYYIAVSAYSYELLVTLGDITYLEDGAIQKDEVQWANYKYYTFQALNTSIDHQNITITASPCSGSVALYMSQGIQPSKESHNWGDDRNTAGERIISITDGKFTNQYFYIAIYGQGALSKYEVSVDTTNRAGSSPDVTYASGSSDLIASSSSSSTIHLELNAARSRLGSQQLTYSIYYTTYTDAVMFTDCGVRNTERVTFYTSMKKDVSDAANTRKISFDVEGLQPSTAYQFSVVVSEEDTSRTVYTPSGRITTSAAEESSMSLKWLLGLGVPLFVLLASFVIYLVIRNRRLTKELEIEMHDVPKGVLRRAVGRGAALEDDEKQARASKPYSNLLTDGDERSDAPPTEDADAYHPPDYARQL